MKTNKLFFLTMFTFLGGIIQGTAQENTVVNPTTVSASSVSGVSHDNVLVGNEAGASLTGDNTAQINYRNVFLGSYAGRNAMNTPGFENARNTYLGFYAGGNTSGINSGSDNVFVGHMAGWLNTEGIQNVIIKSARQFVLPVNNITGRNNSMLGYESGEYLSSGNDNSFFGVGSGRFNTTGSSNSFFGNQAGGNVTTGLSNVCVGSGAGLGISTGSNNLILGRTDDLPANLTGSIILADGGNDIQRLYISNNGYTGIDLGNNVIPQNRLEINSIGGVSGTTGLRFRGIQNTNTSRFLTVNNLGDVVLANVPAATTNPDDWHMFGNSNTLPSLVSGVSTWQLGAVAASNFIGTTDNKDIVFRRGNIKSGVLGDTDTAFGRMALANREASDGYNTAIGFQSLAKVWNDNPLTTNIKEGTRNTAVGVNSLATITEGTYNVALGFSAGNTCSGGSGNVYIGVNSGPAGPTNESNKLYINSSVPNLVATPLIAGDFSEALRNVTFNVNGGTTPFSTRVDINGRPNESGLRFIGVNSGSVAVTNPTRKVLSVNDNAMGGDVILVNDRSIYDEDGDLSGNRTVHLGSNSLIFNTATAAGNIGGRVYIGNQTIFDNSSFGTATGNYKLYVEGGILADKAKVALRSSSEWKDDVFNTDYSLMPLKEVEAFIEANKHLPGIESAEELVKSGLDLGTMQAKQMGKIEELTLYAIAQAKKIEQQSKDIEELKALVKTLLDKK